jgi:phospholipase/carboxylesterase
MASWFDIVRIPVAENEPLCPRGLDAAVSAVHAMLRQTESLGFHPSRVVLAGFSQGGALALEAARRYPRRLGGAISLSGWLPNGRHSKRQPAPPSSVPASEEAAATPFLLCHGLADDVVLPEMCGLSLASLKGPLAGPIDSVEQCT